MGKQYPICRSARSQQTKLKILLGTHVAAEEPEAGLVWQTRQTWHHRGHQLCKTQGTGTTPSVSARRLEQCWVSQKANLVQFRQSFDKE
jgi:hypothetical protein